jgi:hypothetical protein
MSIIDKRINIGRSIEEKICLKDFPKTLMAISSPDS